MTAKQKKAYLKNPNVCPCCGSKLISTGFIQVDGKYAWCEVSCSDCQEIWSDVYTLTAVEDVED